MKARRGIRLSVGGPVIVGGLRPGMGSPRITGLGGVRIGSGRPTFRISRKGGQYQIMASSRGSAAWGQEKAGPGVTVITCTNRPDSLENILANYLRQIYSPRELVIVVNNDGIDVNEWRRRTEDHSDISILQLGSNHTLGECLNYGVDHARYDYVAKCDDDDYYAPKYLAELMPLFSSTGARIVGKCSMFVYFEGSQTLAIALPGNENIPVSGVAGATMIISKEVFTQVRFNVTNFGEDSLFLQECVAKGIAIFSGDRFNFVCIRGNPDQHTWQVDEAEYLKYCEIVAYTPDYISMITQ
ncbi:MAG: glycosyltransferase family 2 protein [Syntrophomonadaceae bacterium]|nr:glycosyltransferase family 2 protein [Syntrophomonadaceae bacterium]